MNKTLQVQIFEASSCTDARMTISCSDLFRLSEKNQVDVKVVGKVCDDSGVRVTQCQLGCFK